jgi:nanoRNase/pAp phosphatase (c-di-AMP/oligoRNAs hydrolase)
VLPGVRVFSVTAVYTEANKLTPESSAAIPSRAEGIRQLREMLRPGLNVALSTHINADGDGCGSEVGFAHLLMQLGMHVRIVNPTPWPAMYEFLLPGVEDHTSRGAEALSDIDLLIVLDINDVRRLGTLAETVRALKVPVGVIDHHLAGDEPVGSVCLADTTACATAELVYDSRIRADFASATRLPGAIPWQQRCCRPVSTRKRCIGAFTRR